MESGQITRSDNQVVFTSGDDSFTVRDLIDWAAFHGELEPIWQELLRLLAAEAKADESDMELDDSAIDAAAEAFRYDHDLITAEETERWLEERGLTLNDFSNYFVRHYWGNEIGDAESEQIDYASAPDDLRELLVTELILSDEIDRLAKRLSWRVAQSAETEGESPSAQTVAEEKQRFFERTGTEESKVADWLSTVDRDQTWLDRNVAMEALYRQKREALLNKQAREHEISAMRIPLTRFELETMELDSLDAAREAMLCVRDDGTPMEEVADEGRYPYRRAELLLEDLPEDLQQKFLSVSSGDVLEPIARGEGFHICRVIEKAEPKADDEAVRERAEQRILDRYFSEITAKHIQWRISEMTS